MREASGTLIADAPPHDHTIEPGEINRRGCLRCEADRAMCRVCEGSPTTCKCERPVWR